MKKKIILVLVLILTLIFTVSCGSGKDYGASAPDYEYSDGKGDYSGGVYDDVLTDKNTNESLNEPERKVIKVVNETVETEDYDGFINDLRAEVAASGGYISNSSFTGGGIYNQEKNRRATFELRIPAERLAEFTASVDSLGAVTYYNETASDVTLTYVDITSRIKVLEAEEAALLEILSKAASTEELITIRRSLTDVQSQLASLRGQRDVIDSKVAYSTVHLSLREVARVQAAKPSFGEEIGGNFAESLENIGEGFRAFVVWLIGDSLYILLVCALLTGAFFLARYVFRRVKATRVKKNGEKGEEK